MDIDEIRGVLVGRYIDDAGDPEWDCIDGGEWEAVVDAEGCVLDVSSGYDDGYETVYIRDHRVAGREDFQGVLLDTDNWAPSPTTHRGLWDLRGNARIGWLAGKIYAELGYGDHTPTRERVTSEICDWLRNGDAGAGRSVRDLTADWREYQEYAEDALDNGTY